MLEIFKMIRLKFTKTVKIISLVIGIAYECMCVCQLMQALDVYRLLKKNNKYKDGCSYCMVYRGAPSIARDVAMKIKYRILFYKRNNKG